MEYKSECDKHIKSIQMPLGERSLWEIKEAYMEEVSELELVPQMNKQDFCNRKFLENTPDKEMQN